MRKRIFAFTIGFIFFILSFSNAQLKWFDFNQKESTVTYILRHPLHRVEAISKEVSGRIEVDRAKKEIRSATAQIDVSSFNSGNSNRDSHAMEVIDALMYPEVQYSSTSITQIGDSIQASGKLTFHGITREIIIKGTAVWSEHRLEVNGTFDISLTEFHVERPSLLMIKVDDLLKFSIRIFVEFS